LFIIQLEDGGDNKQASTFDSQVYLFETAGTLISNDGIDSNQQMIFLEVSNKAYMKGFYL
jgi:hypothetical protein